MQQTAPADLIILDVSLPGEDGISIARRLRTTGSTPILMSTGLRDVVDKIVGLEVGAGDYVNEPLDLRELKARVRSVLRRTDAGLATGPAPDKNSPRQHRVCFGKVRLDLDNHVQIDTDGNEIFLMATEFNLLATVARSPDRLLSRQQLLDATPSRDGDPFDRSIDIRVTRIRKRVEVVPGKPQVIRTKRNAGHIYVPPKAAAWLP